jgi:hypothetical protein
VHEVVDMEIIMKRGMGRVRVGKTREKEIFTEIIMKTEVGTQIETIE